MKNYIDFKPAKCRDCYRCLKSCPVKAIQVIEHQARIIPERCIQCGSCTRVCPQNAKSVHSDVDDIKALLCSGRDVIASVAPSFVASFGLVSFAQMRALLKTLGFEDAEETAVGARAVSLEYLRLLRTGEYKNLISSACPAANRMIQLYYPEALKYLAPVVSPMQAHARILKKRFPNAAIVFIGPCIAKKREADEDWLIDGVLTFDELADVMERARLSFPPAPEAPEKPDTPAPKETADGASAREYPIGGGILRSFHETVAGYEYVALDGTERLREVLANIDKLSGMFIEMNACDFACINGPCALTHEEAAVSANVGIRHYAALAGEADQAPDGIDLRREFHRLTDDSRTPSEDEIKAILAKTGKFKPEDELNCGACGYTSCREKAWAVANGYAEENMCIPYMRSKAESVSSEVISRMPFGIIVLNSSFNIEAINRAALTMLGIDAFHPEGQQLFDFISIPDFVIAQSTDMNILNKRTEIDRTKKVLELSVILLREHSRLLGIFKDVTEENQYNEKLREMQKKTFAVTDDVVSRQMRIAQEIASLLGETTAETKVALLKLKDIMQEDPKPGEEPGESGGTGG